MRICFQRRNLAENRNSNSKIKHLFSGLHVKVYLVVSGRSSRLSRLTGAWRRLTDPGWLKYLNAYPGKGRHHPAQGDATSLSIPHHPLILSWVIIQTSYGQGQSCHNTMTTTAEEDEYIPLTDQRVFGAGIKRKRIDFVPASTPESGLPTSSLPPRSTTVGNHYLSIVLAKAVTQAEGQELQDQPLESTTCPICKQPLSRPTEKAALNSHESSIAHQVCLEHSHPPSHLDREHVGLKYLATYGWDVDSRKGLGAREEGIRIPIKVKEKKDTAGLRERVDDEDVVTLKKKPVVKKQEKPVLLNAKELRRKDIEEKKRIERLRQSFYGPDLEQYLGPDG